MPPAVPIASIPSAIIPTITVLGPLAFLAWLFPVVFGGLAVFFRRWRVLFATAGACSVLYIGEAWLPTARYRWPLLCAAALGGAVWSLARRRAAGPEKTPTAEPAILALLAVACAALGAASAPQPAPPGVTVAWVFEARDRGAIVSTPCVAGDRVYVSAVHNVGLANRGAVYGLDRRTGKAVWRFDNGGHMLPAYSSPCLSGGRLYVGEGMHADFVCRFYCLDPADGHSLWQFQTAGHIESSPCVAGGKVYFGSGDDGLYCLGATSGERCWQFQGPFHIDTSPAVANGHVYAGSGLSRRWQNTEAFCLDADSGRVAWREKTELPVWGSPAVDGDHVFFGLGNGRLDKSAEKPAGAVLCLDRATGRRLWQFPVADGVLARPAVNAARVYFGARDGFAYCLDRHAGTLVWKQPLGSPVVTQPALDGNTLYLAASRGVVCRLDAANGTPVWSFDVARYSQSSPLLYSSPVVADALLPGGRGRQVLFGAELQGALASTAALFSLLD